MRSIIQFSGSFALIVGALFALGSCDKVSTKSVEKTVEDGTWRITYFSEDGSVETADYSAYTFDFAADGTVSATNGTTTIAGTWSIKDDNSNDDSSSDVDFNLVFPTTNNFDDLNDDWDIVTKTDNTIELKDVSGGNGGTDLLTFTKI